MVKFKCVGKIVGFHGLKGEVKIKPLVGDMNNFVEFDKIYISKEELADDKFFNDKVEKLNEQSFKTYEVKTCRFHKGQALIIFDGINSKTVAEEVFTRFTPVFEPEELLYELEDGEFYIEDLLGLEVFDQDDKKVGIVGNFSDDNQPKLLLKAVPELGCKRDIIVPFVQEFLISVDLDARRICLDLSDDLIDLAR